MKDNISKFQLENKIAIVMGGCGLVGEEICNIFASAKAKVIIVDIDKKKGKLLENKIKKFNNNVVYKFFDINKKNNLELKFRKLIKTYKCPDVFVNCSYPMTKDWQLNTFQNITKKSMDDNILLHLGSYSWFAREIAELMFKNKVRGSIIQLGSIYGIKGQDLNVYDKTSMKESMTYSIIKGGIINLTRQMASYYGKKGIRINTLCPGGLVGPVQGKSLKQESNFIKNYSKKVPLGRLGTAEEVSCAALFLASEASSYITGTTLMIDGGWTSI
ncbi:MAG: short-chain dehydrogenase [Parcubacteria group bacterium]|jgi:NAD(P)-dependent dehydrogenase (short-subunit alcohol dehydrogenase family)|nr:short-chain dehydrogenase [Parcubacteria group bacterium]|tara:strand:- start:1781 stop:2599 length:819 start_codon:yes stop_codon:yes gene_type:complete